MEVLYMEDTFKEELKKESFVILIGEAHNAPPTINDINQFIDEVGLNKSRIIYLAEGNLGNLEERKRHAKLPYELLELESQYNAPVHKGLDSLINDINFPLQVAQNSNVTKAIKDLKKLATGNPQNIDDKIADGIQNLAKAMTAAGLASEQVCRKLAYNFLSSAGWNKAPTRLNEFINNAVESPDLIGEFLKGKMSQADRIGGEDDRLMAKRIYDLVDKGCRVVAIMGLGHMESVSDMLLDYDITHASYDLVAIQRQKLAPSSPPNPSPNSTFNLNLN